MVNGLVVTQCVSTRLNTVSFTEHLFFSTPKYFSNIQTQSHTPMERTQGSISSPTILCHVDRSQGVDPLEG